MKSIAATKGATLKKTAVGNDLQAVEELPISRFEEIANKLL